MPEDNARTGWFFRDEPPSDDNAYFENMSRTVFQAGLSWQMIADKWPAFKKAFKDFKIEEVSDFDEEDIERLLSNADIIRNRAKIEATIVNAIAFQKIQEEFESFRNFMDNQDKSENYKFVKKELSKRFARMGPKTAMIFLYSIGENIKHED
ncbi:MAG: DNA-3-methyladenine glycosylase I [Candidatus Heimdallarchaeaceae archaeon]|jgi:DNA-3-methyladenine glycosylase I